MNLENFLLKCISEDETTARAAIATDAPDRWENPTATGNHWPENIAFWDRATPYRVLAECEAKRAIIAEHSPVDPCDAHDADYETTACDTLRHLAAVHSDHPDYQERWKP